MPGLPKRQLFLLSCCRLAEPIAFTSVFPYLYNVIRDLKITDDEKKIGKYGGLVSSVFSLGSFLTGLAWGRASDLHGRKPIILLGLIGTILSTLVFGFSTSIYQLVGSRLAAGLLNGNVGVIRTVVAELVTDRAYQATAFSIMPIVWSIGSIFGPALGGALADPVRAYPQLFGKSVFFTTFRYALPNLVCAALLFCSLVIGWLFLEETLASKRGHEDTGLRVKNWIARQCCMASARHNGRRRSSRHASWRKTHVRLESVASVMTDDVEAALMGGEAAARSSTAREDEPLGDSLDEDDDFGRKDGVAAVRVAAPPLRTLFTRQVTLNIIAYSLLSAHTTSFDQIFPIFLATSVADGGLGLEPKTIGILLSVMGLVAMALQILVFPPVQRRLGSVVTFRVSLLFYCLVYVTIPFMQHLAGQPRRIVCAGVMLALLGKIIAGVFAFPVSAILVTNSVPSARLLGSVNGLNQASGSFMRMLGPAVFGFLLSVSLSTARPALVWLCLAALSAAGLLVTLFLVEDVRKREEADGPSDFDNNDDDDDDDDDGMTLVDAPTRASHELLYHAPPARSSCMTLTDDTRPAHGHDDDDFDVFTEHGEESVNEDEAEAQANDVADHLLEYEHERRKRTSAQPAVIEP